MGHFLNYGWSFELLVNFWIIGELLKYGSTFDLWVTFGNMGLLLNNGDLLNSEWNFKLWVNFWISVELFFCLQNCLCRVFFNRKIEKKMVLELNFGSTECWHKNFFVAKFVWKMVCYKNSFCHFSLGEALRQGRVMVLMCVCVCQCVCMSPHQ